MKWVFVSPGQYKFVSDEDPRPEVKLPDKEGIPNFVVAPPWGRHEDAMHSGVPEVERKATEAFLDEREQTMKTSTKWAKWERSRKERLAKDKPIWRKTRKLA